MKQKYHLLKVIDEQRKIYLIKNITDGHLYVKKEKEFYDLTIYEYLYKHPVMGVPEIKEYYLENDHLIIIEEYIEGKTLKEILNKKYFDEKTTVFIIRKIVLTLKLLNKDKEIVNRDLKPENIIIKDNGEVYLIDFDAARFVDKDKNKDTILLGTKGYASPEQYGFGQSNIQSDIYALGIIMKEMLDKNYKGYLNKVIDKCLKLSPKDRYDSYDSFLLALDNRLYTPVGYRSKKPLKMFVATIVYLLLFIGFIHFKDDNGNYLKTTEIILNAFAFILIIIMIQFSFNYQGIHHYLELDKLSKPLKIILIILIDLIVGGTILTFLESLLTSF